MIFCTAPLASSFYSVDLFIRGGVGLGRNPRRLRRGRGRQSLAGRPIGSQ